jgi:hypothetical protein
MFIVKEVFRILSPGADGFILFTELTLLAQHLDI